MLKEALQEYHQEKFFNGDKRLFKEVFSNPNTKVFWDIDGILANTPKPVLKFYSNKAERIVRPYEINGWDFLTTQAIQDKVEDPEAPWYDRKVLKQASVYMCMRDAVGMVLKRQGRDNNYVLTSREPYLAYGTRKWLSKFYKDCFRPKNILIRRSDDIKPTDFKVNEIKRRANEAPYVVLIDDSVKYIKAALDANIPNLLAVNIPLGTIYPDFVHPQMVVINRFPQTLQAMYTFREAVRDGIN